MKKHRKHYTPEEKVAILRRHLLEKEPISKLCDELGLQPTVFYRWQKEFFENGAAAFEQKQLSNHSAERERIAYLEKKIQTKDEVLAELMAEHVALKKRLGNSDRSLGSARHAGPDRGFRPVLVGEDRDARRLVQGYVDHYNSVRLNSATGYITPKDMLAGRQQEIHAERDRNLEAARKKRQIRRQQAA